MGSQRSVRSKPINKKVHKGPRRRQQRKAYKERFKELLDGTPDSDMEYYENGCEAMLEPDNQPEPDE